MLLFHFYRPTNSHCKLKTQGYTRSWRQRRIRTQKKCIFTLPPPIPETIPCITQNPLHIINLSHFINIQLLLIYFCPLAAIMSLFYTVKVCLYVCVDTICFCMEASGRQESCLFTLHNAQHRAVYTKLSFYLMTLVSFMHFFPVFRLTRSADNY